MVPFSRCYRTGDREKGDRLAVQRLTIQRLTIQRLTVQRLRDIVTVNFEVRSTCRVVPPRMRSRVGL